MKKKLLVFLMLLCVFLVACGEDKSRERHGGERFESVEDNSDEKPELDVFGGDTDDVETTTSEVETETAAETSGEDELSEIFKISLGGVQYQLPVSFEEFAANGWKYADSGEPDFSSGENKFEDFVNGDMKVQLYIYNTSENAKPVSQCTVGGVFLESSRVEAASSFSFADGLNVYSTQDEIYASLGTSPTYDEEKESYGTKYHSIEYKFQKDYFCYVKYLIYDDGASRVTIVNARPDATPIESLVTSETPDYLAQYKAPGLDTKSGLQSEAYITLDGATYCFPCPVTEFTKNGWTINSDIDGVGGECDEQIILKKGNMSVNLVINNFDRQKQMVENCAATMIISSYDNVSIDYFGIKMGMKDSEVAQLIGSNSDWEYKEGSSERSSYKYYVVREDGKKIYASIMINTETGQVCRMDIGSSTWVY